MDKCYNTSTNKVETYTAQDYGTIVHANSKVTPLEGDYSNKLVGVCNLKHETSLPKLYGILINTNLKGDNSLNIKNFYKPIKMCLDVVTILLDNLLLEYQIIKRHSDFLERFVPDRSHHFYYWNG